MLLVGLDRRVENSARRQCTCGEGVAAFAVARCRECPDEPVPGIVSAGTSRGRYGGPAARPGDGQRLRRDGGDTHDRRQH